MMTTAVKCMGSGGKRGKGGDSVAADEGAALRLLDCSAANRYDA